MYEYLEFVLEKVDGEGRKCLDDWLTKWNGKLQPHENPNLDAAIKREADRAVCRIYYEEKALHTLQKAQHVKVVPAPLRLDDAANEIPILEPPDLEEFYAVVKSEFQHASTNYLISTHSGGTQKRVSPKLPHDSVNSQTPSSCTSR